MSPESPRKKFKRDLKFLSHVTHIVNPKEEKKKIEPSQVTRILARHLNLKYVRPRRAGVILYYDEPVNSYGVRGKRFFGFGMDAKHQELTDFGGGVSYRRDHNVLFGALREFREESLFTREEIGIDPTDNRVPEILENSLCVYNAEMLIVFLKVELDTSTISEEFKRRFIFEQKPELSSIVWLPETELKKNLQAKSSFLYSRVHSFLLKSGNFLELLP